MPMGSEDPWNISWNWLSCDATSIAASSPRNIAAPPSVGVGSECTDRAPGLAIAPMRGASHRIAKVKTKVTPAAVAPTMK
jgi:hypothetical protein